jgi:hypothetical protein
MVAVLLVAGVTGIALLYRKDADRHGATDRPTAGTSQPNGTTTATPTRTPAPGKYALAVLPDKLCTKVALGKLGTIYNSYNATPTNTQTANASASNATCWISKSTQTHDTLDVTVSALVHADTAKVVSEQQAAFDAAKTADPNMIVLTGVGEEAFAARRVAEYPGQVTYAAEARDGNLRVTVLGTVLKANRQIPNDEQLRQFGRDLAEIAKSVITKLGGR